MLVKSIAAFAALTFAASVAAEPAPYKPSNMRMSTRDMFGVVRRAETPGYTPGQASCNAGATCQEACGAEYTACASTDQQVHCFNPTTEICCPDKSGNSCDIGYYCTADKKGETFCCPDGMDLAACAKSYEVEGGLVSQVAPKETSTSSTSTSTTSSSTSSSSSTTTTTTTTTPAPAPPTTTTTTTESSTTSTTVEEEETSIEDEETTTSIFSAGPSYVPSASYIPSNTTSISVVVPPSPSQSKIQEGAGSIAGPATALVLVAAGLAAALL
ncbi:hypothetical protein BT67DRAFT_452607 [Trichocladium antarcticum]|uniref:Prp 4 CRoW domain-containing protein n=1 Tax=Trichocladium antarcticum TaxID=1450529 RepID=A0AAN6Z9V0_9PEZI|nr:hypothetical protein BT67DRAFT_452607 [Trichocladium antarcticum]